MTHTITVTHEVTDQFLMDVMVNTVECGAIGYWAIIAHVMRDEDLNITEFQVADMEDCMEEADKGVSEFEITNNPDLWYVIDKPKVIEGIQKIMSGEVPINWDIRNMIVNAVATDDADIDAIGCDCIIQAAMFGELVYS